MEDMILDEFLFNDSLFERIETLSPYPFFDTVHPLKMDELLKIKFGERLVFRKFLNVDLDTIALFIHSEFNNKWNNIILTLESDIKNGSERVLSENTDNTISNIGSNVTENKVSAFNSDELVIDKADNNTSNSETDNKTVKTTSEKLTSFATVYNNLSMAQKLNIINTVISDVAKHLTLDIYK